MVDVGGEKTGNTGGEGGKNFQSSNLRSDNEEEETKWFNSSKNHFGFGYAREIYRVLYRPRLIIKLIFFFFLFFLFVFLFLL